MKVGQLLAITVAVLATREVAEVVVAETQPRAKLVKIDVVEAAVIKFRAMAAGVVNAGT